MRLITKDGRVSNRFGIVCILAAAVMWGHIGLFVRYFEKLGVGSISLVFVRALITVIVMGIFLFIKDRKLLYVNLRHLPVFLGTGIVSFAFFNICYMFSIVENSLSVAAVLLYTSPIWVVTLSAIFLRTGSPFKKGSRSSR